MRVLILTVVIFLLLPGVLMAEDFKIEVDENGVINWADWPEGYYKELQFVMNNKLMFGYLDGLFRPWEEITQYQVIIVAERAGNKVLDKEKYLNRVATMGWVEEYFLPGTVYTAGKDEPCTRFRFALMLYRYGLKPGPEKNPPTVIEEFGGILNKWFDETKVTWNGSIRKPRICGLGELFIEQAMEHDIPLWLALGQCWRESQWFTTGLSTQYNCGWGIKASPEKWGQLGNPPTVQGYGNYISVEEAVKAYFKYMDEQVGSNGKPLYRDLIDSHQWRQILDIYAPAYENDTNEHYNIVMKVKQWCEEKGLRVFDEEFVLW